MKKIIVFALVMLISTTLSYCGLLDTPTGAISFEAEYYELTQSEKEIMYSALREQVFEESTGWQRFSVEEESNTTMIINGGVERVDILYKIQVDSSTETPSLLLDYDIAVGADTPISVKQNICLVDGIFYVKIDGDFLEEGELEEISLPYSAKLPYESMGDSSIFEILSIDEYKMDMESVLDFLNDEYDSIKVFSCEQGDKFKIVMEYDVKEADSKSYVYFELYIAINAMGQIVGIHIDYTTDATIFGFRMLQSGKSTYMPMYEDIEFPSEIFDYPEVTLAELEDFYNIDL